MAETNTGPETIKILLPSTCEVLVYAKSDGSGWISKCIIQTKDVQPGEDDYFSSEWEWEVKPSRERIALHVEDQFKHEVREQLGLKPHEETN